MPEQLRRAGGRALLVCLAACAGCAAAGCDSGAAKSDGETPNTSGKPHVILISLCSVRADHLGCYGYHRSTSPNIDKLAAEAIVFEHAVTPWPKTTPSFCSVMTGRWPHETGVMRITPRQAMRRGTRTLAERFRQAGYRTAAYTTTPAANKTTGLDRGFERFEEMWRENRDRYETPRLSLEWLSAHRSEPCLLWVHFNNAHYPYHPIPRFRDMFIDDKHYDASRRIPRYKPDEEMPITLPDDHPAARQVRRRNLGGAHHLALVPEKGLDPRRLFQLDFYIARYDAGIRTADDQVGQVLNGLRDAIGDDPCIVVLWSDHGEALGEHNYFFEHGRFGYESCTRVPFMIRYDGRWPEARRISQPVSTVDIGATIANLAGLSADGLSGVALPDVVEGKTRRGDVFFSAGYHWDFITGVRRGPFKLMHVSNPLDRDMMQGSEYELYDVASDPTETRNLAADMPDRVRAMSAALDAFRAPWWTAATTPGGAASSRPNDAESKRKLRDMGYLADD
ncbi:MAG: sulfatase [Phycisphaerae bacterium]